MPLFGNKFSLKKTPARKNALNFGSTKDPDNLILENQRVSLKLDDQQLLFQAGQWICESGQNTNIYKSNKSLRKKIEELQEENNMLHLKYEVILNMLIEADAEKLDYQMGFEKMGRDRKQ